MTLVKGYAMQKAKQLNAVGKKLNAEIRKNTHSVQPAQSSNKIIRLPATIQKTGLSRSTIYSLLKAGKFPQRIQLSARSMGFLESEIDEWLSAKADARQELGA